MSLKRVFVIYSPRDLAEVEWLDAALREHGVPLWRERRDLASGNAVRAGLELAAHQAVGFVVYLSRAAVGSESVRGIELPKALENCRDSSSFGMVPVFRGLPAALKRAYGRARVPGEARWPFDAARGYVVQASEGQELNGELAAVAESVLRQTLSVTRANAPLGAPLRAAFVTGSREPWSRQPVDLVVDWSHHYPSLGGEPDESLRLPSRATGCSRLLPRLRATVRAIESGQAASVLQIVPDCHASLALAVGFQFRQGARTPVEVLDPQTLLPSRGPLRPASFEEDLWNFRRESDPAGCGAAVFLGITRAVSEEAEACLRAQSLRVARRLWATLPAGPGLNSIPARDPSYMNRLACSLGVEILRLVGPATQEPLHLFCAAPSTLLVLVARQLANLGPVHCYDFDSVRHTFQSTLVLSD